MPTRLLGILDFDFKATQPRGQQVVERGEYHKENEAERAHNNRHKKEDHPLDPEGRVAEDEQRNANQRIDKAHQEIKGGRYFAGLQDGNADYLLFHNELGLQERLAAASGIRPCTKRAGNTRTDY